MRQPKIFPEVVSETPVLVMADLHLGASTPAEKRLRELFAVLPEETVIIGAGDIVDYWVEGEDFDFSGRFPLLEEFRRFRSYFLFGNRDFLIGPRWEEFTGGVVLGDSLILRTGEDEKVITHGDLLVAGDYRYRAWRKICRGTVFRKLAAALGEARAARSAEKLRTESAKEVSRKPRGSMSISPELAEAYSCGRNHLICGHAHTPMEFQAGSTRVTVLGSWDEGAEVVYICDGVVELIGVDDLICTFR